MLRKKESPTSCFLPCVERLPDMVVESKNWWRRFLLSWDEWQIADNHVFFQWNPSNKKTPLKEHLWSNNHEIHFDLLACVRYFSRGGFLATKFFIIFSWIVYADKFRCRTTHSKRKIWRYKSATCRHKNQQKALSWYRGISAETPWKDRWYSCSH